MKLFTILSTIAAAEAALSSAQKATAKTVFNSLDIDHKGDLTSGGVYTALARLDGKLTEAQLQKASKGREKINLDQFLDIYSKVEGSQGKYPKGCKNWFDGCNHCIIKDGKEVGCTEMICAQVFDGKKEAFCTVYEDGRQCKSATNCQVKVQHYNCFTREVWSEAKKAYCCKTRKMGCPTNTNTGLKPGAVCYAFYEDNSVPPVNRKNDCPKGYKCASDMTPGMNSFNSVMKCVSSSSTSSGIPAGCTSWYDGCNTCAVKDGKKLGCTKMACFRQGKTYCKSYGSDIVVHG